MKKRGLVAVLCLMAGCTATTDGLVREGDWYQVGYQDGVTGRPNRSLNDLQQLGDVDPNDYEQGYLKGLVEYCDPNFAYQIGLSGQEYHGVCEGMPNSQQFRLEFERGQRDFQITN